MVWCQHYIMRISNMCIIIIMFIIISSSSSMSVMTVIIYLTIDGQQSKFLMNCIRLSTVFIIC